MSWKLKKYYGVTQVRVYLVKAYNKHICTRCSKTSVCSTRRL